MRKLSISFISAEQNVEVEQPKTIVQQKAYEEIVDFFYLGGTKCRSGTA